MNAIGQRLREARLARGLTQEQLAKGLATKGFISQVERDHAVPSLSKLRVMADRLGVPLAHFTGDTAAVELVYVRKSAELAVKADEPQRALALVEEGLALLATANERSDLLRIKGTALDALGQLSEALVAHQTAAAAAPPDDPELNAAIYVEIATVLQQQEQFNAAIEANLRALNALDRCKHADPALRSRALHNLGRENYGVGQLKRADQYFQQALAAATDAENVRRVATAHMSLSVSARAVGEVERALEHCVRAIDLFNRLRHEQTANRVLNNLGDVYYASGRRADAERAQLQCLQRARELKDDLTIGVAAGELGRYRLEAGDARGALALAREGQQAAQRSGDHLHQAYAAAIEARAAEQLGHRVVADRKFKAAIGLLRERQAAGKLAEVCSMYADVLHGRGRTDRAYALMRVAAERDFSKLPPLLQAPM